MMRPRAAPSERRMPISRERCTTDTTSTLATGAGTTPAASAPLTVTAAPLALAKTIAPASIVAGGSSTLTLSIDNYGVCAR